MLKLNRLAVMAAMAIAGLSLTSLPALAQQTPTDQTSMQSGSPDRRGPDAQQASRGPTTKDLNQASSRYVNARARYRGEERSMRRQSYRSAMRTHYRTIDRNDRRYMHRRAAYNQAMIMWRQQVRACHQGNRRACRAPAPRTRDFY